MYTLPDLRVLTHTARIVLVTDATPDHVRAPEYAEQLAIYKAKWATFDELTRAELVDAAHSLLNLDSAAIERAVATLEG